MQYYAINYRHHAENYTPMTLTYNFNKCAFSIISEIPYR